MGWGTRLSTREGLGRFGFGLKGSSISQARRVDVFSWITPGEIYRSYLDLDEIKDGKLTELPKVERDELPLDIRGIFGDKIGDSGTLVWWTDLDQMDLKRAETLISRVNRDLCRIYRHFLDDDNDYGTKRNISIHLLQTEEQTLTKTVPLLANDPLYQLAPNNLDGYRDEVTNELHGEPFSSEIPYFSGVEERTSTVEFRFTIAKPSIQNLGGSSAQGKHYAKNTGISFVRAGREIDFGHFGFLDASEPRHRWWGAEVRFDPVLDELFGVTNNKQEVRFIKKLDKDLKESLAGAKAEGDYRGNLLLEVNELLDGNISSMMRIIKGRREGERNARQKRGLTLRVNEDVSKNTAPTESQTRADSLTAEQKLEERIKLLLNDDESMSEDKAKSIAEDTLEYRVDLQTADWAGQLFLDRRPVANASVGIINRNTKFYDKFWLHLEEHADKKGFEALEILIMAFVRAEDELVREYDREIFERFRERWGYWAEGLIKHAAS